MTSKEKAFLEHVGESYRGVTPGFCLQAFLRGRAVLDIAVGETWRYYDWASLTKIVFSATAAMTAVAQKRLRLQTPVREYFAWFESIRRQEPTRVRHLLTHSAGLEWWRPYYKELMGHSHPWLHLQECLQRDIQKQKNRKIDVKAVYSDLDLFFLGMIFEKTFEQELLAIWEQLNDRMQLQNTRFHPGNKPYHSRDLYAPTENCPVRGRILQGEVHDENTWSLGGVAPHAGLFGPMDDLSRWGLLLRGAIRGANSRNFVEAATVQKFARRATRREQGDWALGMMIPTKGAASCGSFFSLNSVGHTGFTGTSLWYDPKQDLLVTILSNRVHPTRENNLFAKYRPQLHNWVVQAVC